MRTFTTTHTVYKFDELTEEAQQKALENLSDVNVDYDWWDVTYEDAKMIGLELTGFDLYRHEIDGKLTEDMQEVCKNILKEHGDTCDTHTLAKKHQFKHGEDNEQEFLKELLEEYFKILQSDYEYRTGEEAIKETIEANEYEFYEDGRLA